jgi:hypothetical protein
MCGDEVGRCAEVLAYAQSVDAEIGVEREDATVVALLRQQLMAAGYFADLQLLSRSSWG